MGGCDCTRRSSEKHGSTLAACEVQSLSNTLVSLRETFIAQSEMATLREASCVDQRASWPVLPGCDLLRGASGGPGRAAAEVGGGCRRRPSLCLHRRRRQSRWLRSRSGRCASERAGTQGRVSSAGFRQPVLRRGAGRHRLRHERAGDHARAGRNGPLLSAVLHLSVAARHAARRGPLHHPGGVPGPRLHGGHAGRQRGRPPAG